MNFLNKINSKTFVSMQACVFIVKGILEDCFLMDLRIKNSQQFFCQTPVNDCSYVFHYNLIYWNFHLTYDRNPLFKIY